MAGSKVQFQKGLSERQFRELYGTEERCRAVAFGWRWQNGFVGPRCGGGRYSEIKGRGNGATASRTEAPPRKRRQQSPEAYRHRVPL